MREQPKITRMIPESDLIYAHALRLKMWLALIVTVAILASAIVAFVWLAVGKGEAIATFVFICILATGIGFARLNDASQERDRRFIVDFQRAQNDIAMQSGPDMNKVLTSWMQNAGNSIIAVEKQNQIEDVKQLAKQPNYDDGDIEINMEEIR